MRKRSSRTELGEIRIDPAPRQLRGNILCRRHESSHSRLQRRPRHRLPPECCPATRIGGRRGLKPKHPQLSRFQQTLAMRPMGRKAERLRTYRRTPQTLGPGAGVPREYLVPPRIAWRGLILSGERTASCIHLSSSWKLRSIPATGLDCYLYGAVESGGGAYVTAACR